MSGVCTRTGLARVDGPVNGFRIAKTSYGPLNPPVRPEAIVDRSDSSRFDTPGSTVYLSGDAATAYAGPRSPWARWPARTVRPPP
ncbi:hypothetical protein KFL01_00210 [Kocuria flava]|uniref:Uncharacterized protein n=1 Tax=Kocuria flava TaxID=446860 RepID=A0ABQ0X7K3_9MICC|nr:hypothetical protein KFL01_00210 [Kocuria flava]